MSLRTNNIKGFTNIFKASIRKIKRTFPSIGRRSCNIRLLSPLHSHICQI